MLEGGDESVKGRRGRGEAGGEEEEGRRTRGEGWSSTIQYIQKIDNFADKIAQNCMISNSPNVPRNFS